MIEKKYNMTATKADVIAAGVKQFFISKQYVAKAIEFAESMEPGQVMNIADSDTRHDFVRVMKLYIYIYQGFTFKSNYEKIQKDYDKRDFIYPI